MHALARRGIAIMAAAGAVTGMGLAAAGTASAATITPDTVSPVAVAHWYDNDRCDRFDRRWDRDCQRDNRWYWDRGHNRWDHWRFDDRDRRWHDRGPR